MGIYRMYTGADGESVSVMEEPKKEKYAGCRRIMATD